MRRLASNLWRGEAGSVAPLVAIGLFALVGAGGLAFDYARLAGLDSELQSAADQAALAAATQLDGKTNARTRAQDAATSLFSNRALFANDGVDRSVTIQRASVVFYQDKAKTTAATADNNANFVEVAVDTKRAFYALTPVVAAFSSAPVSAKAFAGVGSAICKVPPVMLCNPGEPAGNTDENYAFTGAAGLGMKLITGNATVPGNFGWLQSNIGNGASALAEALGYNTPPGDCSPTTGVTTKTGMDASVLNALNTRFDIFANGNPTCPSQDGGTCSPASNVRKDLVCNSNNGTSCSNDNWSASPSPYRPTTATALPSDGSGDPDILGYPRDMCHALPSGSQTCGVMGDGNWDRDAYFRVNYKWTTQAAWIAGTGLTSSATRYQVYNWEMANPSVSVSGTAHGINVPQPLTGKNTGFSYPATGRSGVAPGVSTPDRRRISVAVLNCQALGVSGKTSNIAVATWLDVFLVEPSFSRGKGANSYTDQKEVYVEVIGPTTSGADGATAGQVVRKDVPYLIE